MPFLHVNKVVKQEAYITDWSVLVRQWWTTGSDADHFASVSASARTTTKGHHGLRLRRDTRRWNVPFLCSYRQIVQRLINSWSPDVFVIQ